MITHYYLILHDSLHLTWVLSIGHPARPFYCILASLCQFFVFLHEAFQMLFSRWCRRRLRMMMMGESEACSLISYSKTVVCYDLWHHVDNNTGFKQTPRLIDKTFYRSNSLVEQREEETLVGHSSCVCVSFRVPPQTVWSPFWRGGERRWMVCLLRATTEPNRTPNAKFASASRRTASSKVHFNSSRTFKVHVWHHQTKEMLILSHSFLSVFISQHPQKMRGLLSMTRKDWMNEYRIRPLLSCRWGGWRLLPDPAPAVCGYRGD